MNNPTPQDYERARAAIPCNGCGAESDDGYLHDEYCPAQKWEAVATALVEQRERDATTLEGLTIDENFSGHIHLGFSKAQHLGGVAIRQGDA